MTSWCIFKTMVKDCFQTHILGQIAVIPVAASSMSATSSPMVSSSAGTAPASRIPISGIPSPAVGDSLNFVF